MAKIYDIEDDDQVIEFDDGVIEELSEDEEEISGGAEATVYQRVVNLGAVSRSTTSNKITMTKGAGRTIASITTTSNTANCSFSRSMGNVTLTRKALGVCKGTVTYTGGAYYTFSITFK